MENLSNPQLKYLLKVRGLGSAGSKNQLILSLRQSLSNDGIEEEKFLLDNNFEHTQKEEVDQIGPKDSASQVGSKVSGTYSEVLLQRQRVAAKKAEAMSKLSHLEEINKIKLRMEEINLMTQLDVASAEERVLLSDNVSEHGFSQVKENPQAEFSAHLPISCSQNTIVSDHSNVLFSGFHQASLMSSSCNLVSSPQSYHILSTTPSYGTSYLPSTINNSQCGLVSNSQNNPIISTSQIRSAPNLQSILNSQSNIGSNSHNNPIISTSQICSVPNLQSILNSQSNIGPNSQNDNFNNIFETPLPQGTDCSSNDDVIRALVSSNVKGLMPKQKIHTFNGDHTQYYLFIRSFDNVISSNLSPSEQLNYLEQFTSGRPNEIVRACLHLPPDDGYVRARQLLDRRYGNPNRVIQSFVDKVTNWENIGRDDVEAFDEFAVVLSSCDNAVSCVPNGSAVLSNPETLKRIIQKFPAFIRDRWCRAADELMSDRKRDVTFSDLVSFVDREARIIKNPYFGKQMLNVKESTNFRSNSNKNSAKNSPATRTFRTDVKDSKKNLSCWYCKKAHLIDQCNEIETMSQENKIQAIRGLGLCFACLRSGHRSNSCTARKTCDHCKGGHPTLLHFSKNIVSKELTDSNKSAENSQDENGVRIYTNISNNSCKGMSVVPVNVRSGSGRVVQTMAFLDGGSTGSFCTESLLKRLGIENSRFVEEDVLTTTMNSKSIERYKLVPGLSISDLDSNDVIMLPPIYAAKSIPVEKCDVVNEEDLSRWPHLQHLELPRTNSEVEIMIGNNVPHVLEPWEIINSTKDFDPHALKTRLGWVICGAGNGNNLAMGIKKVSVARTNFMDKLLIENYNQDFQDLALIKNELSIQDKEWLNLMETNCRVVDGKYQLPLPLALSSKVNDLPDSKPMALKRLSILNRKLCRNKSYADLYCEFMDKMLINGYAELVEQPNDFGTSWYIPHFGVQRADKPGKVRVVFDCAAKVQGISLNDCLVQGPDLLNSLVGVLLNFRIGCYAYSADIETMYYQVKVTPENCNYLKFLWYKDNDFRSEPREFRMRVHLFGASSSPNVASFALKKIARDFQGRFSEGARKSIESHFYVDDLLYSCDTRENLVTHAGEVKELCRLGGFNLTKFCSGDNYFLRSFSEQELSGSACKVLDGAAETAKTLGVSWNLNSDELGVVCDVNLKSVPATKRELLSYIASIYDPLGLLSPLIIEGRVIMQHLCRLQTQWDQVLSVEIKSKIISWVEKIKLQIGVKVSRCIKPIHFESVSKIELHYFSDASQIAFGVVSYLRVIDKSNNIYCVFLMGKSKVAPLKSISVPRLELTAATLAVKMNAIISDYVDLDIQSRFYWTDSSCVLRYIMNDNLRFQTFVANRVSLIRECSSKDQWRFVNTTLNPADDASRGKQTCRWTEGPEFLLSDYKDWPKFPFDLSVGTGDLEIKREVFRTTVVDKDRLNILFDRYSSWIRLLRGVGWLLQFKSFLKQQVSKLHITMLEVGLSVKVLALAESSIVKVVQRDVYSSEILQLSRGNFVSIKSSIAKLKPILVDGILRVGGRLSFADLQFDEKFPTILPYKGHVTDLIIMYYHQKVGHLGRSTVLSTIRSKYWIVKGNAAVRRIISGCVICKKVQGKALSQQMACLPPERIDGSHPPFYNSGLDAFGPFYTKRGRSTVKRYGIVFTCLNIRAVHLEVAFDLSSDSFINALRRFLSRRGQVKMIRCDHGSNFMGAKNIHDNCNAHVSGFSSVVNNELLNRGIEFQFNPPTASHFGGAWERMIRTIRKILGSIIVSQTLNDDSLQTLFCEIECIINSRPLSAVSSEAGDVLPITPNKLINLGDSPLGIDVSSGSYSKSRWSQVQYMADQFWSRWKKEYLLSLQERQKWLRNKPNVKIGDIVLMINENLPRCHWNLARITDIRVSKDGLVRSVTVKSGSSFYERPLSKLVRILEDENLSCN